MSEPTGSTRPPVAQIARFITILVLVVMVGLVVSLLGVSLLFGPPDGTGSDGNSTLLGVAAATVALVLAIVTLAVGVLLRYVHWIGRAWLVALVLLVGIALLSTVVMAGIRSDTCTGNPYVCGD
jgi:hypothetical protein